MEIYVVAATCVVLVGAIVMLLVFSKNKSLNTVTIVSIAVASLIAAIALPYVFRAILSLEYAADNLSNIVIVFVAALLAYIVIIFIMSFLISYILPKITKMEFSETQNTIKQSSSEPASVESNTGNKNNYIEKIFANFAGKKHKDNETGKTGEERPQVEESAQSGMETSNDAEVYDEIYSEIAQDKNARINSGKKVTEAVDENAYVYAENGPEGEEIISNNINENITGDNTVNADRLHADDVKEKDNIEYLISGHVETSNQNNQNNEENAPLLGNNLEKSVDSSENIDKMGIENKIQESNTMTVDECIEEAFRLKESGDYEAAILYYKNALDKKPDKSLVFWVILDICALYKIIGQQKVALDILDNYTRIYGDIFDVSIKDEIIKNLTDAQV